MIASKQPMLAYDQRRVSAGDTVSVIITKSLLCPLICISTLLGCLLFWDEPLTGPYFLIAVLTFIGAAEFLDFADIHGWRDWKLALRGFVNLSLRWLLVVAAVWLIVRLGGLVGRLNSDLLITWAVATPFMLWLGQEGARYFLVHSDAVKSSSRKSTRSAVIVGATDAGMRLEHLLRQDQMLRTDVLGYFDDRQEERLPNHGRPLLGMCSDLPAYVGSEGISVVYIALPMYRCPRISQLLESLRDSTASIYFVPDLYPFDAIQARLTLVRGVPLVAVCETPFFGMRGLAKRVMDIAVASLAIISGLPIFLLLALAIAATSRGPVIFKQKRYGLDGKPITVLKFRSMTVTEDGDSSYTQVSRNDARVTRVGALMRKSSLDELPQLFNVLGGSMSIVGPRPHAVAVNETYRKLIPGYMVRHKIKPGITGWAQVNGYRGGDDLDSMRKRIEFDLDYLNRWSLNFDYRILFMTVWTLIRDKSAY